MSSSKNLATAFLMAISIATFSGCGFQLRGSYELPYKGVYVAAPSTSAVASNIRRDLTGSAVKVLPSLKDADAQLNILEERRDRQILSLSGAGQFAPIKARFCGENFPLHIAGFAGDIAQTIGRLQSGKRLSTVNHI